ncbi:MAG: cardiolipin synthase, partial [Rhodoferax sp.]|nr:cardiolipin synthase [Rhodoferax sp.]
SFRLNDEATLNIIGPAFAAEQTQIFEADLAKSRRVSFEAWQNRPLKEKAGEMFSALIASQL